VSPANDNDQSTARRAGDAVSRPAGPCPEGARENTHIEPSVRPEDILVIRRGPGANCSSIGSVLDVLFLSAIAGGAILVGVAALLDDRPTPRPEAEGECDEDPSAPGAR